MATAHCQFSTIAYLKEHFSKERGYLFDDDPEFVSILQTIKDLPPLESAVTQGNQLESINISTEDIIPALHPASFNPIQIKNDVPAPAPQDDQDFVILRLRLDK